MGSKYRLTSSAFLRKDEDEKINPLKVFFLSVEGNDTEEEYFQGVRVFKNELGITALVDIEVLHRGKSDTNSAPKHVLELLEEYLQFRGGTVENIIDDLTPEFNEKYSREFIEDYIYHPERVSKKKKAQFDSDLRVLGYDLNYRKYLLKYESDKDEFCIIIDRDIDTHSEENMKQCIEHCKTKKYNCYINNPCFEFWLLLHLCDVKQEYETCYDDLLKNVKKSNRHTYVSKEVFDRVGHGKCRIHFEQNYLPYIDYAINRAEDYETEVDQLVHKVGSNLGKLFIKMREF